MRRVIEFVNGQMNLQISKDIGVDYCLNCTAKIDCDGTVDRLCPIFINRLDVKKKILQHKVKTYIALSDYLKSNGPMTTKEIVNVFNIPRTNINKAIREGLLQARWLNKKERQEIKGGIRGRFAYLVLAVDLNKVISK